MLVKTSVALDKQVLDELSKTYPAFSLSQIMRESMKYMLANKPEIQTVFVERGNANGAAKV